MTELAAAGQWYDELWQAETGLTAEDAKRRRCTLANLLLDRKGYNQNERWYLVDTIEIEGGREELRLVKSPTMRAGFSYVLHIIPELAPDNATTLTFDNHGPAVDHTNDNRADEQPPRNAREETEQQAKYHRMVEDRLIMSLAQV